MNKTRSFSIYLLKTAFDSANALKDEHGLDATVAANNLPENATLFILDKNPMPPWWKSYFDIKQDLNQVLKGAIVFIPVENRTFAITFGHVSHNLKNESYEYDFGLRVTLNSLDPNKLKSLDSINPENARRQRTQLSIGSDLTLFDFDHDSTILKSLTGAVKKELSEFFKNATGASNIRISSICAPNELAGLTTKLLELYNSEEYKTTFPDIQNISPVKDPDIIEALNLKLVTAVKEKDENLTLTIPEIVNYQDGLYATFTGLRTSLIYDDVFIDRYYECLENANFDLNTIDVNDLKKHCLVLTNETGQPRGDKANILKCLIFDTTLNDGIETYHLSEGNWYLVDQDYVAGLSTYLDPLCNDTTLPNYSHANEGEYNEAASNVLDTRLNMDRKNISPKGQSQIEPCDIFEIDNEQVILHHVKRSTESSTLSHLFNQGLNSIQIIRDEEAAPIKLRELAISESPDGEERKFLTALDKNNIKVTYQIITHKDKAKKSLNLPLFSRISLKRTMKELRRMGIDHEFCFVQNDVPKSNGKKKPPKKRKTKTNNGEKDIR